MNAPQITAEELREAGKILIWLTGILVTALGTGIGFLVRLSFKLGAQAEKFGVAIKDVDEHKKVVPIHTTEIGHLKTTTERHDNQLTRILDRGSRPDGVCEPVGE